MGAKRLGGKRLGRKRLGGETTRGRNGLGAKRPGFAESTFGMVKRRFAPWRLYSSAECTSLPLFTRLDPYTKAVLFGSAFPAIIARLRREVSQ